MFIFDFFKTFLISTFALAALCSACAKVQDAQSADIKIGDKTVYLEIAATDAKRMRGLMFRTSLAENSGMIFVHETPQCASFWMKNTKIPLDIGFFTADGTLTQVCKLYPNNLNSVKSARDDILYSVEMPQDWFAKNGISVGDKITLKPILKKISKKSR